MVDPEIDRARHISREAALSDISQKVTNLDTVYLVVTYHPALSKKIFDIVKRNHNILQVNEEHRKVFKCLPKVSFRRAKSLRDFLVRSKLKTEVFKSGSCNGCNRKNCLIDTFLDNNSDFTDNEGKRLYNLRKGDLNCNSKFVVYKIKCKTCSKQYIGSTVTRFRERFNNYKSHFKKYLGRRNSGSSNPGKDIPQAGLFEHFLQADHHGMEDWSFQIIDQADSLKRVRERESFWQFKLNSFIPNGLNDREVTMIPSTC